MTTGARTQELILVTGAAGRVGGVGRTVVELLRARGLPVRAFVHRDDDRAAAIRALGAEVAVGDLTRIEDVSRALDGVRRICFLVSVSAEHLQATVTMAALARALGERVVLVNLSQMTVSQMSATRMTDSPQHRQDWLGEQVLNGSGLPVVHLRPTVFLQNPLFLDFAAKTIAEDSTIRVPFRAGHTSPVSADDVASVAATILIEPAKHVGRVYELTGPRSEDMAEVAAEYSSALGRTIRYVDVPFDEWRENVLGPQHFSEHLASHMATVVRLHAENRYDRFTREVERITGHPATSVRDFVVRYADRFRRPGQAAAHP
jgi:uncharacterized protein YbjT (DUF2867 family)